MPSRLIDSFGSTDAMADVFSDEAVLAAMLRFEAALARAQARLGMIPASAAAAIEQVDQIETGSLAAEARQSASLAIPFVKALRQRLQAIDPAAAEFVHHGSTTQDVLDTALMLLLKDARRILAADHARLAAALRALSGRHRETVMTARTLLQPAMPTTFGYKSAGWFGLVERSWRGLSRAFDEGLLLQFGGAAGTLASSGDRGLKLAEDVGRELDLAVPGAPWHAHRDRLAAIVAHCAIYAGSLAKIARDVTLLMQAEVGEAAERGGESSAMPGKRNPSGSVVVLAAAARVPGLVAAFLGAMPQEHERAAGGWQSEWPLVAGVMESTASALTAIVDVVDGLTVDPARMGTNAGGDDVGMARELQQRLLEGSE